MSPVFAFPYQRGTLNPGQALYARPRWDTALKHTLSSRDLQEFFADKRLLSSLLLSILPGKQVYLFQIGRILYPAFAILDLHYSTSNRSGG